MSEKKVVVDQLKLTYEGIMDVKGLIRMMKNWFYEKGYDMYEHKNFEQDLPGGRVIEIELAPWKKTTTYYENSMRIRINFTNIRDIEVDKDSKKLKLQTGKLQMIFDGYLRSDYDNVWGESQGWKMMVRTLYDKYILRENFAYYERWLVNDLYDIHGRIQRFLNLYKYDRRVP